MVAGMLEPKDGSELFVARARAILPGFVASQAVVELCRPAGATGGTISECSWQRS